MLNTIITRNLLGLEDLLVGEGSETQTRAGEVVDVTKINAKNFPYDAVKTLDEKLDEVITLAESLSVVDTEGTFLTGYLNTSDTALDLEDRLWRKTPTAEPTIAELWYENVRVLQYNKTTGDLILPPDTDYIAADAVVVANQKVITDQIIADYIAADTVITDSLGTAAALDVGTTDGDIIQLGAGAKLPAVDGSQLTNIIPIGSIFAVPYSTPDTGFLECNGQEISRTTYAALYAKIGDTYGSGDGSTTFKIPDYRGEFLRGWDNARGVDVARVLGTNQADEFKAHTHTEQRINRSSGAGSYGNLSVGSDLRHITQDTGSTGGAETRPRNISVMYQIKAL